MLRLVDKSLQTTRSRHRGASAEDLAELSALDSWQDIIVKRLIHEACLSNPLEC